MHNRPVVVSSQDEPRPRAFLRLTPFGIILLVIYATQQQAKGKFSVSLEEFRTIEPRSDVKEGNEVVSKKCLSVFCITYITHLMY